MKRFHTASLVAFLLAAVPLAQWSKSATSDVSLSGGIGDDTSPSIAIAGDGSTYVAWRYDAQTGTQPNHRELRLQRYSAGGRAEWPAGGIVLSTENIDSFFGLELLADDAGNAWLAYLESVTPGSTIRLSRIGPDGTDSFGPGGFLLASGSLTTVNTPIALDQLSNGNVLVATNEATGIRFHRFSPAGAPLGSAVLIDAPAFLLGQFVLVDMVATSDGGAYVLTRSDNLGQDEVRIHKIDSTGQLLLPPNGALLEPDYPPLGRDIQLVSDEMGGAYVGWRKSTVDLRLFHYRADGTTAQPGGIAVPSPMFLTPRAIDLAVDAASGDAILAVVDANLNGHSRIGVRRINGPTGTFLWGPLGTAAVPFDTSALTSPSLVRQGNDWRVTALSRSELWPATDPAIVVSGAFDAATGTTLSVDVLSTSSLEKEDLVAAAGPLGDVVCVWENGPGVDLGLKNVNAAGTIGPVAGAIERTGPGTLPGYSASVGPIGTTAALALDLSQTGAPFGLVVGFMRQAALPFASSTILVDVSRPEILGLPNQPGPIVNYNLPIPNDASLCGTRIATQGVHFSVGQLVGLSHAQDLFLGI